MDIIYDLHSLMIVLAFAFVIGSGIGGYLVGTVDRKAIPSTDFKQGMIWAGLLFAVIAGLLDWANVYNNGGFELGALCWLGVSGGFFSLWLGVGLSLGPAERR